MFEDLTKEEIERLLADYVATATAPEYKGDRNLINSKFPEFESVDKRLLADYVATATAPEYKGDRNLINSKFPEFFSATSKKKEDGVSESADGMPVSSEKVEATMSLGDPRIEEDLKRMEEEKEPVFFDQPDVSQMDIPSSQKIQLAQSELDIKRAIEAKEVEEKTAAQVKADMPEVERLEKERQEALDQFRSSDLFTTDLEALSSDMISVNTDDAIKQLADKYSKYGVSFYKSGRGKITVRNADGSNQMDISLPSRLGGGYTQEGLKSFMEKEAEKLKGFVADNAIEPEYVKDEDYINKSFKVMASRRSKLLNEDGTSSTVRMASSDNLAHPMIFPKDPNKQTSNPEDWIVFDPKNKDDVKKAIALAKERGEIYEFKTPEEANEFAEGGWKDVSIADLEGEKFFRERNLDYLKIRDAERRRDEIQQEMAFIEEEIGLYNDAEYDPYTGKMVGGYKPSEEKIKENPHIYLKDGTLRSDVKDKLAELAKENEELSNVLYFDENTRTAIQDYNLHLHKRYEEYSQKAAEDNKIYDASLADLNALFKAGRISDDDYKIEYQSLKNLKQTAANEYLMASTYFNAKTQKGITGDFEDNLAAVALEIKKGIQNGNASAKLLALSLGLDPKNEYSAEELAEMFRNMDKRQGRAFYTYMNSATASESFDAFISNPIEVMASMIGNSFAQMLPIGYEIVSNPELAAPVIGTGMVMGAGGGLKGMIASSLYNLQATTSFALEYGNSIMDAGRQKYNLEDPQQVLEMFNDPEVWEEGARIGKMRGLAIGLVDRLSAGFAGRVFKTAETASRTRKATTFLAERMVFDPLSEGVGEYAAQVASGQEIEAFEIINEMLGGPLQNVTTGAVNVFLDTDQQSKIKLAYDLTSRDAIAKERSSFNEISNWTARMKNAGQIDQGVADAIQENLVLRNEARDLLGLSKSKKSDKVVSRTMDLLKAQKTLNKDENSRKVYKDELSSIDNELSYMVKNGKLAPEADMTDIKNIKDESGNIVSLAPKVSSYFINGKRHNKISFKKEIDKMSDDQRKKASFQVINDEELKSEIEESYGVLPVQRRVEEFGPAVAEERYQTIDEVPTEIQEAATIVEETEDGKYRIGEEVFDEIPSEVMDGDAVITQNQDGTIDVQYKEDKFVLEDKPLTEVYDTREAIPQTIRDAASTQIVENDEGKFEVTYKESEVIGQVLGKKKPSTPQFMLGEEKKPKKIDPKIQKLKDDGVYDGILDILKSNQVELAEQLLKGQNVTLEEFISNSEVDVLFNMDVSSPVFQKVLDTDDFIEKVRSKVRTGETYNYSESFKDFLHRYFDEDKETVKGFVKSSFKRKDPKTGEPTSLRTEDGYRLARTEGGQYINGDFIFESLDQLSDGAIGFYATELTPEEEATLRSEEAFKEQEQEIKDDPQFQLDTKVDTEVRKKELEEQAIQQMEEVLPETAETIEDVDQADATKVEIKENEEAVKRTKIKRFKLKDIIGKSLNLLMADKLKIKLLDPSKPYNEKTNPYVKMGGPFFPLMEKMFGKVAWASINDAAASKIIIGAMNGDYSAVYNMGDGGIDSNIVMAETLDSKIPENQKAEIFKLIKERILSSKDEKIKKAHEFFKNAKNLMDAFEKMTDKDTKVGVDVRAAVTRFILPETVEGKTDIELHNKLKDIGVSLETVRDENAEQFTKDIPTGALTMVVEVHDENGVPVRERKAELDKKLENKEITKKQYNNEINAIIESAKMSLEQQKKEGVPSHRNYPVYIRGKAIAVMEETAPFFKIIKKYSEQGEKRAAGIEKKKGVGVKKDATDLEKKIYDKFQEAKKLIKDSKRDNNKKEEAKKIMRSLIRAAKKLNQEQRAEMVSGLKEALSSNNKADIKAALGRAEVPVSKMVDYTQKEIESAAVTSGATTSTTSYSITQNLKDTYEVFVERLSKAIPGIEVVTSQKEFDALLRNLNTKSLVNKDQKVYGAVYNGKLYLNPGIRNFNTPIHEFGHIWLNTVKELRRDLYDKGVELIQEDDTYINQIKSSKEYNKVIKQMKEDGKSQAEIDQYILEEALATAIGDKGESFANAAQTRNFKGWLTDLFNFVKKLTGISKLSANEIQNMTLDQFLQGVVVDLLSDNELFKEAEVKNLSNQLQMMSSDGSKMSISDVVRIAREEGFSDKSIKSYLKSEGFKAAEINQAMTIHLDMFTEMPDSFINVFNGSEQGINMFNDIKESLNNWLTSRWGKGKSFAEYRAKAMEILAKQPLFDKQSDINKQKLMSGMDQVIGRRKAKDASAPIKSIKDTVELIKKNNWEADIPGAKKSLLSAIKTLAGTKLHKEKLSKIKGLINKLDSKNHKKSIDQIDTILKEIIEDDKAITTEMNVKLRALEKKMSLFSKMEDYLKMKTEGSQAIKDIDALAKALVRSIGEDNRGIVDKMQALLKDGINTKNAKEKIPELADLLSDLIFEQKTKKDEISQLNNVIKNLREKREQRRLQAKQLKEIKAKIVRDIRSATIALRDLGVKDYTYTDLQRLTAKVRDANINNIDKVAAQVANIFSNVEERGRKKKLKDILSFIKKSAEPGKRSGRLIGKGSISADGQAFFDAANQFVKLLKNIPLDEIKTALDLKEMLDSMTKEDRQDALDNDDSVKSSKFLIERLDKIMGDNQLMAGIPDMLMGLGTMTLEQLNFLDTDLKLNRMAFAIQLASKKAIEKAAREELKQKASEQIQEQYEMLYKEVDEDGETVMKPKNSDELSRINKPFKKIFKEEGAREMFRAMVDRFKLSNIMVDFAGHLTAVCSVLDNLPEGKAFFTENIVKRLNRAQARFTKGLQEQREMLDSFAASINPNYKYDDIKKKIFNTKDLKIKDDTYSGDQMLRIYALLKNNVQRDKLIKENGLTKDDIDNINNSLDPDVKAFADMVIDYLSNDYYDQINNVYRDVNNINLPKIDNYFPTQTVSEKATVSENIKALAEMATGKFSAQGESFLKQRTSVKGPVAIYKGTSGIPYTFTDSLDGLMGGSERFKAYAKDAKILNSLLNSTDISNLMKMTGLKDLVNNFINNAISPVVNDDRKMDALRFLFSRYIGVALSWKFWQIPKQASSFVMAFPEYQLAATEGLPPIVKLLPNLVAFLGESALTYVNLRKNFKEAYNTSPMFRERVQRFKRSGFSALETSITEKQAKSKIERALVKIEKIGSSATFMGDIMGVMGYWTNYKRDIANGMDPKLALEKFEDYNKTQQTQRDTEINKWQLKGRQNPAWMAITTFASTPFLMQSIILESVSSMSKMAKKEKGFKKMMSPIKSLLTTREGMRFIFALGVGNAIFAAASNAMKMMYGDEEDEEDFYKEINKAATGYNTLASLPFLSQAVDLVYEFAYDDENVYGQQEMLNPLSMAIKEISGGLRKKKGTFLGDIFGKEKDTKNAWNSAFKYTTGINTDPMIGLYEFIKGEAGAGFKALGITKSYLPKEKKSFLKGGDILPEMDILEE